MESIYKNPAYTPKKRAEALLGEMTLEEKMAQVNCVFPFGEQYNDWEMISAKTPFGIGEVSTLECAGLKAWKEPVHGRGRCRKS